MRILAMALSLAACACIQPPVDTDTDRGSDSDSDTDSDSDSDASPAPAPAVDGVVDAGEWDGAASAVNTVASDWGPNRLDAIHARIVGDRLFVAVEGTIEPANAIVVWVEGDPASGIADPANLTDTDGAADVVVALDITDPASFSADAAWATREMSASAVGFDPRQGWREIDAAQPGNLLWVDASEAPSVCGAAACETSVGLDVIGGGGPVSLYARLAAGDGSSLSNQTLPEDDPGHPGAVGAVLDVPR